MLYDALVAGGGPAGLFAALAAAETGARTALVERMPSVGRKLLVSGSGQCNLTRSGPIAAFLDRYGTSSPAGAARFLRPSLFGFPNRALAEYLEARGLPLEEAEGGKVFPATRRARDLRDLLVAEARRAGVDLVCGARVSAARRTSEGFELAFGVGPDGAEPITPIAGRTLVLATGGASYPSTGSSGDGYALATGFGHRIVAVGPALASAYVDREAYAPFVACAGLALRDRPVAVLRGGRRVASGRGDVLFTHRGLSGPGILDLSRSVRPGDELALPLAEPADGPAGAPAGGLEAADARLLAAVAAHGKRGLVGVLAALGLADGLARALIAALGLDPGLKAAVLARDDRRRLAASLSAAPGHLFPVAALGGWGEAMATRGGVDLDQVDPKTMASRLVPGLYFAGEVLDYDGDTGGYNIQAACSTGRLAGASAAAAAAQATAQAAAKEPR